jgi:DNA polymerase-3 subunit beta
MHAIIQKKILEKILISLQPYIDKKNLSQVTSHIYIDIKNSNLEMKATDYEMGIELRTDVLEIKEEGNATANGKKLLDIIKNLLDENITIYTKNNYLNIKQNNAQFKIPMYNPEEFPKFPKLQKTKEVNINSSTFAQSLKYALPCVDINNPKYELNGTLINFLDNKYDVVSTDTKRLSIIENLENNIAINENIILHKKSTMEIQKIINESSKIYLDKSNLLIKNNNILFFSKLINGTYPEYQRIVPTTIKHNIKLSKEIILDALKNIYALSSTVNIVFNKNKIRFSTMQTSQDKAQIEIDTNLNIDNFTLNVSIKYIMNFLTTIEDEEFIIQLNEEQLPFVLLSKNFKTIIMPLAR